MNHLDLFSGIGGFAYAADQVFGKVEHVFCDNEPFAQAVLRKHWPESYIFNDIRSITANTLCEQRWPGKKQKNKDWQKTSFGIDLITGGFPCQPFSAAGLRRGTADDRHLWPEMLRVIRLTEPTWVIAENVGGILSWNGGLVFEQVCADLEAAGYTVQPFVIPAVAVNAPHRRDRVWFIATNTTNDQQQRRVGLEWQPHKENAKSSVASENASDTSGIGRKSRRVQNRPQNQEVGSKGQRENERFDVSIWRRDWSEIAAEFCSVDDGLPVELDGFKLTKAQHRKEQLKAYGNAIVPQVAMEIMRASFNP